MRALVVDESMYGNTHAVASSSIADGLLLDPDAGGLGLGDWRNTLLYGESVRARRWGTTLGAARKTHSPAHA